MHSGWWLYRAPRGLRQWWRSCSPSAQLWRTLRLHKNRLERRKPVWRPTQTRREPDLRRGWWQKFPLQSRLGIPMGRLELASFEKYDKLCIKMTHNEIQWRCFSSPNTMKGAVFQSICVTRNVYFTKEFAGPRKRNGIRDGGVAPLSAENAPERPVLSWNRRLG